MRNLFAALMVAMAAVAAVRGADTPETSPLAESFRTPPDSARPWVYWFWNNANVTREGITADLEAMRRVGIGGVLIMDVLERFAPPRGTAEFMTVQWKDLFQYALQEAHRLGLEISMTNGPGWCGSSGPWITPELSMQKLVDTTAEVTGPKTFSGLLLQPPVAGGNKGTSRDGVANGGVAYAPYYRDVTVLAFPATDNGVIRKGDVIQLTPKMSAAGELTWEVPAGRWLVKRIGHTTTGSTTRPPIAGGNGLECDKLSATAMDVHFAGMLRQLIDRSGPLAGTTLVRTHIDSWEVGDQNWTPRFCEEFQRRRGYDPVPYLPSLLENVIVRDTREVRSRNLVDGEDGVFRFKFDFIRTRSELMAENYVGRLAELAHQRNLRLSIEGYRLPFGDQVDYAGPADEPMAEFWCNGWGLNSQDSRFSPHQAASIGHTNGRTIIGAEAFTATEDERWKFHPARIKALGDARFAEGINRFVIHRYAHQPYLDKVPGATMGPWGLHYERTQTWWEMSGPWHTYLARTQQMLRQGLFVADLCYMRTEWADQTYLTPQPTPPPGYKYDEISPQTLIKNMTVHDGRLTLPDGMSYRVLVLPPAERMTVPLMRKIHDLIEAGATVVTTHARPTATPSFQDYPDCDKELDALSRSVWGTCDGKKVTRSPTGKGMLVWGEPLNELLQELQSPHDFSTTAALNWIHRRAGAVDLYFVANPLTDNVNTECTFRIHGKQPELWDPETGEVRNLSDYSSDDVATKVPLCFGPTQSYFVVFRSPAKPALPGTNFPAWDTVQTIQGWTLTFPATVGTANRLTLDTLTSWTDREEPGIKYFSGTATYASKFQWGDGDLGKRSPIMLNLGTVEVMAHVRVNGQDCGIAWKPPYRVDVTRAVKAGDNTLEVDVANLWPNRMIGDAGLPEDQRQTWSSWEPFKRTDPLLKSGMMGPVILEHQKVKE